MLHISISGWYCSVGTLCEIYNLQEELRSSCSSFGSLALPSVHLLLHLQGDGYQALNNQQVLLHRQITLSSPLTPLLRICGWRLTLLSSTMFPHSCHVFATLRAFMHVCVFLKMCVYECVHLSPWSSTAQPLSESSCWWISLLKSAVPAVQCIKDYQLPSTLQRPHWCKWMCSSASYPFSQGLSDCGAVRWWD